MIKQTMFFSILIDLYFSTKQHYCNSKAVFTCKRANRSTKFVKKTNVYKKPCNNLVTIEYNVFEKRVI